MITKEEKIKMLEALLFRALSKDDSFLLFDRDDTWSQIDKIIKINEYIEKIKSTPTPE